MAAFTFCVSFYACFLKLIATCRLCAIYLRIIVLVYRLLLLQCLHGLHGIHGPRYPLSTHSPFSAICRKRTIFFRHCPSPCSPIDRKKTQKRAKHCSDVMMRVMASQITSLTSVYSAVHSGTHGRKHQSSASLAFVWGIHRWPVNCPHKGPVTRQMFPLDDVMMEPQWELTIMASYLFYAIRCGDIMIFRCTLMKEAYYMRS